MGHLNTGALFSIPLLRAAKTNQIIRKVNEKNAIVLVVEELNEFYKSKVSVLHLSLISKPGIYIYTHTHIHT